MHFPRRQQGMNLIELMIAMTIGVFLVGGALAVFVSSSDARNVNENVARMQENARYAMTALKNDLRLAGMWGQTRELGSVEAYKGTPTELDAITGDCADRWYIDLANAVEASNDTNPYSATCLPASEYAASTDVLVVRHVDTTPAATLQTGGIYIRSDSMRAEVFEGSTGPANTFSAGAQDYRLLTHAYYIRPYSFTAGDGLPSLHRLVLASDGTDTELVDEEVITGIEDLQVQYGVDDDGDGSINRYLNPDSALGSSRILAVRLWIVARADAVEAGFVDSNTYTYASKSVTPNDNVRRLLLTSTIQLRNLIPAPTT